jgi:hypothetical protein
VLKESCVLTKIKIAAFCGIALIAVATTPKEAEASLVLTGNAVIDTTSGLEWLQGSVTQGQSPNSALANNPGYQLATFNQLKTLLEDAGLPGATLPGTYTGPDYNTIAAALEVVFNYSIFSPGDLTYETLAEYMNTTGAGQINFIVENALFQKGLEIDELGFNNDLDSSNSLAFDLLVRDAPVPEPASIALWGAALAGLGLLRRRNISA